MASYKQHNYDHGHSGLAFSGFCSDFVELGITDGQESKGKMLQFRTAEGKTANIALFSANLKTQWPSPFYNNKKVCNVRIQTAFRDTVIGVLKEGDCWGEASGIAKATSSPTKTQSPSEPVALTDCRRVRSAKKVRSVRAGSCLCEMPTSNGGLDGTDPTRRWARNPGRFRETSFAPRTQTWTHCRSPPVQSWLLGTREREIRQT